MGSPDPARNKTFVEAVNRLNPSFVLELSATPKLGISNILVNISGLALKEEEMIKLPIQLRNFPNSDWRYTLAQTKVERDKLEEAAKWFSANRGSLYPSNRRDSRGAHWQKPARRCKGTR